MKHEVINRAAMNAICMSDDDRTGESSMVGSHPTDDLTEWRPGHKYTGSNFTSAVHTQGT